MPSTYIEMDEQKIHRGAATLVSLWNGNGRRGVYKDRVSTKQAILIVISIAKTLKIVHFILSSNCVCFSLTQNPETSHIFWHFGWSCTDPSRYALFVMHYTFLVMPSNALLSKKEGL